MLSHAYGEVVASQNMYRERIIKYNNNLSIGWLGEQNLFCSIKKSE